DGELAIAADEFLGAIERIDQPEPIAGITRPMHLWDVAGGDRFFGYDGYVRRERLQGGYDHRLRRLIGCRHRRGIGLGAVCDDALVVSEDDFAGPFRDRLGCGKQWLPDRC